MPTMGVRALAPGETYGDSIGVGPPDPGAFSDCQVVDDFGTIVCPDNPDLPANLQPYSPPILGGAINDAVTPIKELPGQIGRGLGGLLGGIEHRLEAVGIWVIVVLALVAFTAFEVRR